MTVFGDNTGDDEAGTEDLGLDEVNPTTNQDAQTLGCDVGFGAGTHRHSLLTFTGLNNLGAGTVTSAIVSLYPYNSDTASTIHTITFKRALLDWGETTATWNTHDGSTNWTTAGCLSDGNDRSATVSETLSSNDTTGAYQDSNDNAQIRSDCEDMRDSPSVNYGWHMERTDDFGDNEFRYYRDSEASDGERPYITVTVSAVVINERTLSDAMNITDSTDVYRLLLKVISDNLGVSDSVTIEAIRAVTERVLTSALTLTDSIGVAREKAILITDNIDIEELIRTQRWRFKLLNDSVEIFDNIIAQIQGRIVTALLQDSLDITDTAFVTREFTKQLLSTITLTDSIIHDSLFFKLLSDNIDISDEIIATLIRQLREITLRDNLNVTDSIAITLVQLLVQWGIIKAGLREENILTALVSETGHLAENWLLYSEELDNAVYSIGALLTVTADAINDPNGNLTADKIECNTTGAAQFFQTAIGGADQSSYSFLMYMKEGNKTNDILLLRNKTTLITLAYVRLVWSTHTLTIISGSEAAGASTEIINAGNGWYRVRLTVTTGINNGDALGCYFAFTDTYTIGEYAYGWGLQLVGGEEFVPYHKTIGISLDTPALIEGGAIVTELSDESIDTGIEQ